MKWVVCHGPDAVHYTPLAAGQVLTTGQPNAEVFDTEAEAEAKAVALGYQFPRVHGDGHRRPRWESDHRYHPGDEVEHNGKRWVATSHNRGNEPDDVPGDWSVVA